MAEAVERSSKIVKKDHAIISPSYTRTYPFVIDRGAGSTLWDIDGRSYLDFTSGVAVASVGHSNPDVVKAIREQVPKLSHSATTDFYSEMIIDVAEQLQDLTPGSFKKRVFFTNSGTESNECAFKLARWKTKKQKMIAFTGGFHGRTFGSMTLTGAKSVQRDHFSPLVPGVVHIPFPNPYRPTFGNPKTCGDDSLSYLKEQILDRVVPSDEVAALIVEPIQGEEGYIIPPMDFHKKLMKLCKKEGFLYIADEVQTGFARSGKWFASDVFGVEPDIITLAKALGGGMPMGACVSRREIMTWPKGSHASTFSGNHVCCAAALASINYIKKNKLWQNAEKLGKHGLKYLKDLQDDIERRHNRNYFIGDSRGLGLMLAIELVKDKKTKVPAKKEAEKVLHDAYKSGLLLLHGGQSTIRLVPPLVITKEEFDKGLEILAAVVKKL